MYEPKNTVASREPLQHNDGMNRRLVLLAVASFPAWPSPEGLADFPTAPLPRASVSVRGLDFAKLRVSVAAWHSQKPMTFRVVLDSRGSESDGNMHYGCTGTDGVERSVWFRGDPGIDPTRPLIVRGQLVIHWHRQNEIKGQRFKGFWEMRIVDAVPMEMSLP